MKTREWLAADDRIAPLPVTVIYSMAFSIHMADRLPQKNSAETPVQF